MSVFFTRLAFAGLWLLHGLPLPVLAFLGNGLGSLLYILVGRRRKVVLTNLRLCFPKKSEAERVALAKAHFRVLTRSFLERSLLWWAPESRLRRLIHLKGEEHIIRLKAEGRPILLFSPHFVGFEVGGCRLSMEHEMGAVYLKQKNPVVDEVVLNGRARFRAPTMLAKQEGVRGMLRLLRSGRPMYFPGDLDHGSKDAVFVPFFGIQAATITSLSRLSKMSGAAVLPLSTEILPGGQGYLACVGAPWENFPSDDVAADTRRVNAWLESAILKMPEQYYWVHRRFKTRPEGEAPVY